MMNEMCKATPPLIDSVGDLIKKMGQAIGSFSGRVTKVIEQLPCQMNQNHQIAITIIVASNAAFFTIAHFFANWTNQLTETHLAKTHGHLKTLKKDLIKGIVVGSTIFTFNLILSRVTQYPMSHAVSLALATAGVATRIFFDHEKDHRKEISGYRETLTKLEQKLKEVEDAVIIDQVDIDSEDSLAIIEKKAEETLTELKNELLAALNEKKNLEKTIKEALSKEEFLENSILQNQNEIQALQQTLKTKEMEAQSQLKKEAEELQAALSAAGNETELHHQAEALIKKLQEQLAKAQQDLEDVQNQSLEKIDEVKEQLNQALSEGEAFKKSQIEILAEVEKHQKSIQQTQIEAEGKINELQKELTILKAENEALKTSFTETQTNLQVKSDEYQQAADQRTSEIMKLTTELADARASLQTLSQQPDTKAPQRPVSQASSSPAPTTATQEKLVNNATNRTPPKTPEKANAKKGGNGIGSESKGTPTEKKATRTFSLGAMFGSTHSKK